MRHGFYCEDSHIWVLAPQCRVCSSGPRGMDAELLQGQTTLALRTPAVSPSYERLEDSAGEERYNASWGNNHTGGNN